MIDDTKNHWWPQNSAMIVGSPELRDLVNTTLSCMAWSGSVMNALWADGYRETHVLMTGGRVLSQIKASVDLVFLGYYAEAVSTTRDAFEMTNMLACIINDADFLEKWKNASKQDHLGGGPFSPAKVRKKAAAFLSVDLEMQNARYSNFCKLATHPDNNGIFFFQPELQIGGLQRCHDAQAKGILEEISFQSYLVVRALNEIRPATFDATAGRFAGIAKIEELITNSRDHGTFFGLVSIEDDGWSVVASAAV